MSSDIARHFAAIANAAPRADAARGTDTGHVRIESAVAYAAEQFNRWSMTPGPMGEAPAANPWLQIYPVPGQRHVDYDSIAVLIGTFLRKGGVEVVADMGEYGGLDYERRRDVRFPLSTTAVLVSGRVAEGANGRYLGPAFGPTRRPTPIIVAGPHTPATAATIPVQDKVIFYVPPTDLDSLRERQIVDTLARAAGGSRGVVVVTDEDSVHFAARRSAARRPLSLIDEYMKAKLAPQASAWAVYVHPDSLHYLFTLAGLDLAALRRATAPVARESLPLSAWFWVPSLPGLTARPMAVNAVSVVQGSDSALQRQYVVVSAHAGDDADPSGVAALLEVARAFNATGARPRRSLLFVVATSGAGRDFAGAEYVAAKLEQMGLQAVANVTLGRLGGAVGDSLAVNGLDEIDPGARLSWVAVAHPDETPTPVSGSLLSAPCADHCAFVRRKMPSLYLHDPGVANDTVLGRRAGVAGAIDATRTARAARLAFYLVQAMANADRAPRWRAGVLDRLGAVAGD